MPAWLATIAVPAVVAAIVAAAVSLAGHLLSRRSAKDQVTQAKTEEIMRTVRWACERAWSKSEIERQGGVAMLQEFRQASTLKTYPKAARPMVTSTIKGALVTTSTTDAPVDSGYALVEIDAAEDDGPKEGDQ